MGELILSQVHIVTCFNTQHEKFLKVLIHSIKDHLLPTRSITVHALISDYNLNSNHNLLCECCEDSIDLIIYPINISDFPNKTFSQNLIYHPAYNKLLIGQKIDDVIQKVFYFDLDILVLENLAEFFDFESESILSASSERPPDGEGYSYFNSGVMVIDLKLWRENCFTSYLFRELQSKKGHTYLDQDVFNNVCREHQIVRGEIPKGYNYQLTNYSTFLKNPSVVHFSGPQHKKPWNVKVFGGGYRRKWRKLYIKLNPEEKISLRVKYRYVLFLLKMELIKFIVLFHKD